MTDVKLIPDFFSEAARAPGNASHFQLLRVASHEPNMTVVGARHTIGVGAEHVEGLRVDEVSLAAIGANARVSFLGGLGSAGGSGVHGFDSVVWVAWLASYGDPDSNRGKPARFRTRASEKVSNPSRRSYATFHRRPRFRQRFAVGNQLEH